MCKNHYGYMRVSSSDQNEDRQRIELIRWGIAENHIYCDKQSGKNFNRPQYQHLKKTLQEGDVLVVQSIDRLGRNYKKILEEWRYIINEKKADIVIIDMPLLDTRTNKDLIGTLISDIVLQLLSYVAEMERINIKQRQAEGIAAAKQRGVHLGRCAMPIPENFPEIYTLWQSKEMKLQEALQQSNLTRNQFYWMIQKYRNLLNTAKHPNVYSDKISKKQEKS